MCRNDAPALMILGTLLVLLLSASHADAQTPGGPPPPPRERTSIAPLLVGVEFEGNFGLTDQQLLSVIKTKPTVSSTSRRLFLPLSKLLSETPLADKEDRSRIRRMINSLGYQIRYLNYAGAAEDTARIRQLYLNYGYHDATVTYRIELDTVRNTSNVRYYIEERRRYPLRGVYYEGIQQIPAEVKEDITDPQRYTYGDPYSQTLLSAENDRVVGVLRNNGYPFAAWNPPPRVFNVREPFPGAPYDSAYVKVYTGGRYRFGETVHRDDTLYTTGTLVNEELILAQREYEPGQWYSRDALDRTIANLYSLETFDLVSIDTNRVNQADSTLDIRIQTRLRPQNDFRVAPELVGELIENKLYYSLGATSSYSRLNVFGGAERFTVGGRVLFPLQQKGSVPLSDAIQWGTSVSFFKPSNFLGSKRLGILASASYDFSLFDPLPSNIGNRISDTVIVRARQLSFLLELPWRQRQTFFTQFTGRFNALYNKYFGIGPYVDAYTDLTISSDTGFTAEDRPVLKRLLTRTYFRIPVLQGDDVSLVDSTNQELLAAFDALKFSYIVGFTMTADRRNNFFSPTDGHLIDVRIDVGTNGSFNGSFIKVDLNNRFYIPTGGNDALAAHARAGIIIELGSIPLTPASSRFYAGGANSIRGWNVRDMIATTTSAIDSIFLARSSDGNNPFIKIIETNRRNLGGLGLLELSVEWRKYPFRTTSGSGSGGFLSELLLIPFVDAGNAFFRDREDFRRADLGFFFSNIALAAGISVGYNTPVGPFRIGFGVPIYDPVALELSSARERWIFNRRFFDLPVFHVGIGHAF